MSQKITQAAPLGIWIGAKRLSRTGLCVTAGRGIEEEGIPRATSSGQMM